jgi:IS30 family transposase
MAKAGQLRARGWSHRQIAAYLGVSHQTIMRDLARLERVQEVVQKVVHSQEKWTAKRTTKSALDTNVVAFTRREAE